MNLHTASAQYANRSKSRTLSIGSFSAGTFPRGMFWGEVRTTRQRLREWQPAARGPHVGNFDAIGAGPYLASTPIASLSLSTRAGFAGMRDSRAHAH